MSPKPLTDPLTHSLCDTCFQAQAPRTLTHDLEPVRSTHGKASPCCICGNEHQSGIFIRREPALLPCQGEHAA